MALLAASQWLHAPRVEYLVPFVVATGAAVLLAIGTRGDARWWTRACSLLLAASAMLATPAQLALWRVRHDWEHWRAETSVRGLEALKDALDEATSRSVATARRALDASADRENAFDELEPLADTRDETGVVLLRRNDAFAWAGTIRPPIDWSRQGITVVATPFYLAIQLVEQRGDRTAAVVSLLDAAPPADNLALPLARRIETDAGLTNGFHFAPASDSTGGDEVLRYAVGGTRLFDVRVQPLVQGAVETRIAERVGARAGLAFVLALACFVIGVWRGTQTMSRRVAALAIGLACTALVPLNQYSNLTRLFDPTVYFTSRGSTLTGNAGALLTTGAITLLGILAVFRRQSQRTSRWVAAATVLLVAGLGPFLLRDLARGVQIPQHGVDSTLWLIWEIPLFLAAVCVLLTGTAAGMAILGPRRGLPPWVAPLAATIAAILAPVVWEAPGRWPWWYTFLWVGAIGMLAFSRRSRSVIISASTVAALGATTLVWGRTARGRVDAAVRDLASLSQADMEVTRILRRFGASLAAEDFAPESRQALLQHFVVSDIASAGNPVALYAWPTDSAPIASFQTADIPIPQDDVARIVHQARTTGALSIEPVATSSALELVMAVPSSDGGVTAVVMAPKSRLFEPDAFARLLGLDVDPDAEPPYTVRLRERVAADSLYSEPTWRRVGTELHGDWVVNTGKGAAEAHVEVELRTLDALIQRGALIVLLNLAIVGVLWFAGVIADGGAGRWIRARRRTWGRSYRAKLSVALLAFFVIPAVAFAVWSYGQLATDAIQSRSVLVRETLRAVDTPRVAQLWLPAEGDRLDSPLFLYQAGELREASDPLYDDIAPVGRFLDRDAEVALTVHGEATQARLETVGGAAMLFGYRSFPDVRRPLVVIGAPARADELELGRRRRDLGVLVAFATAIGAIAALWLSGIAARQLSRPIGTLREAALTIASGARMPTFEAEPTDEFRQVFTAFRRMDADLNASRTELEEAQRWTTAVLRNVASGVVAVDADARVSIANPRAETLLGGPLVPGIAFDAQAPPEISRVVERFLKGRSDEEQFEISIDQQQLRGTLTRLMRGGIVVTVDDVTELARAQRVLAWGEMARQVAHEIKNPLTPIRLGVQHLRRARADARVDFDRVLEHNVKQILAEIDRLDEIARAFSRYGAAPEERRRAAPIDIAAVVREVVSLERMGQESHLAWEELGVDVPVRGLATTDELKEVLLNVLENARHAAAKRVTVAVSLDGGGPDDRRVVISVSDDGHGISPDVLPRVFEPHFSTRTSGSGLGLAISRQLVEGWGGEISLQSTEGVGTEVQIRLRATPTSTS